MDFKEALNYMKMGTYVKRPHWGGYWAYELVHNNRYTIVMYDKNGGCADLFDTDDTAYTLDNLAETDFIIATEENTPILGGEALFDFNTAFTQLCKGRNMTRKYWGDKSYIRVDTDGLKLLKVSNIDNVIKTEPYNPTVNDLAFTDWTYYE